MENIVENSFFQLLPVSTTKQIRIIIFQPRMFKISLGTKNPEVFLLHNVRIVHALTISREGLVLTLSILPSALKISLHPQDFPRTLPSGNLLCLGKYLGHLGWIFQYLPCFGGVGIQSIQFLSLSILIFG